MVVSVFNFYTQASVVLIAVVSLWMASDLIVIHGALGQSIFELVSLL